MSEKMPDLGKFVDYVYSLKQERDALQSRLDAAEADRAAGKRILEQQMRIGERLDADRDEALALLQECRVELDEVTHFPFGEPMTPRDSVRKGIIDRIDALLARHVPRGES